jgi:hypothetical protein
MWQKRPPKGTRLMRAVVTKLQGQPCLSNGTAADQARTAFSESSGSKETILKTPATFQRTRNSENSVLHVGSFAAA